jgi:hypothetical protein
MLSAMHKKTEGRSQFLLIYPDWDNLTALPIKCMPVAQGGKNGA